MISQFFQAIFIFPVKIYQYIISPILPGACRYHPTCSNYTIQAIKEWGPIRGTWMGIKRMSTCHPWGGQGLDEVPKNPKKNSPEN